MSLRYDIAAARVPAGCLGVFWLGQAGFAFKTPGGEVIAVDPYLSDCCERYFGFRRLMPKLIDPTDFPVDLLVCTHAHYDHFDPDAVPLLLAQGARLFAAKDCAAECERLRLAGEYAGVGDATECGGVRVEAVRCDHGAGTPDAIGLLLRFGDKCVYLMGDTCLRPDWYADPVLQGVDLLIAPINGAFGNLDGEAAAEAAALLRAKRTVPCHFWNFAEHHGDPDVFAQAMRERELAYTLLPMGGSIII